MGIGKVILILKIAFEGLKIAFEENKSVLMSIMFFRKFQNQESFPKFLNQENFSEKPKAASKIILVKSTSCLTSMDSLFVRLIVASTKAY